ncbi:putative sensor histidine kinase pdtaS [bacterium HR17]|uniref:histidine kinase n=1 Tax=Candidatus Fervidibacter japonicus TaxID=2035412 RepID=A0A2H5X9F2_9BACT|nr:putative sensor histidine kinase pdtaS [bacterium HR17]
MVAPSAFHHRATKAVTLPLTHEPLPEAAVALAQRYGLGDVTLPAFALQTLTALGNGDGRLLARRGDAFVTLLAARQGKWDERVIGKTIAVVEEPFAAQVHRKRNMVIAPLGLVRGVEPVTHCAALIASVPSPPLVVVVDLPLLETHPVPAWRFPHRLLASIAKATWGDVVPSQLLAWAVQGRSGVSIWDATGRRRWGDAALSLDDVPYGLTVTDRAVWLRTDAGTVGRLQQKAVPLLRGYALLRSEVHHRVKNDLQSVISWLRLQARTTPVDTAKQVLLEAAERLRTFATVHDLLARERGESVALRELIWQLAHAVVEQARHEGKQVRFTLLSPEIRLSPKQASALAAALHELLRNACKHAFERDGTLAVQVTETDGMWRIEVTDDGKGFDPQSLSVPTLGLTIVRNLIEQDLNGRVEIQSAQGQGTTVRLFVPRR